MSGAGSRRRLGIVQLYTGNGKGKTTAALGQALRAAGHGFRVLVIQFLKGGVEAGEHKFTRQFPGFEIIRTSGRDLLRADEESRRCAAQRALELAREAAASDRYDLVVLDEAVVAASKGAIDEQELIALVQARRPGLEIILTGRYASAALLDLADTVTEMQEVKHHYRAGIRLTAGRDY